MSFRPISYKLYAKQKLAIFKQLCISFSVRNQFHVKTIRRGKLNCMIGENKLNQPLRQNDCILVLRYFQLIHPW